jgi:azurin
MFNNSALSTPALVCSICQKPVSLNDAKTDEDGMAVHEDCYLIKVGLRKAVDSPRRMSGLYVVETRLRK